MNPVWFFICCVLFIVGFSLLLAGNAKKNSNDPTEHDSGKNLIIAGSVLLGVGFIGGLVSWNAPGSYSFDD